MVENHLLFLLILDLEMGHLAGLPEHSPTTLRGAIRVWAVGPLLNLKVSDILFRYS